MQKRQKFVNNLNTELENKQRIQKELKENDKMLGKLYEQSEDKI